VLAQRRNSELARDLICGASMQKSFDERANLLTWFLFVVTMPVILAIMVVITSYLSPASHRAQPSPAAGDAALASRGGP
jgi:hypothetical protein